MCTWAQRFKSLLSRLPFPTGIGIYQFYSNPPGGRPRETREKEGRVVISASEKLSHYTVNDPCFVVLYEFPHVLKTKFFIAASGLLYNFEIKWNHLSGGVVYFLEACCKAYTEMGICVSSVSDRLGGGKPHFCATSAVGGFWGPGDTGFCQHLKVEQRKWTTQCPFGERLHTDGTRISGPQSNQNLSLSF